MPLRRSRGTPPARPCSQVYQLPLDLPTGVFLLYNFSAVGTLLVFWTEYGCGPTPPLEMQQAYLIGARASLSVALLPDDLSVRRLVAR